MKLFSKIVSVSLLLGSSFIFSYDIFQAIEQNNKKFIKQWVQDSCDLDLVNDLGQTVLIQATIAGNKELVKRLLKKGVEVNKLDNAGKTALDYAIKYNQEKIVLKLVQKRASVTTHENFKKATAIVKKRARLFLGLSLGMVLVGCLGVMPFLWLSGYTWMGYACFFAFPIFCPIGVIGLGFLIPQGYWYRQVNKVQII